MIFRCPHCNESVAHTDETRGQNVPCQNCGASVHIPRRGGQLEVAASDLGIHPALMRKYQERKPNIPSEFEVDDGNISVQLSPSLVNEKEELTPDDDVDLYSEVEKARARSDAAMVAPERSTAPGRKPLKEDEGKAAPKVPALPTIPGFTLRGTVGSGAMGHVYRATDNVTGELAAVKVLASELASRPDFVARFEREAAALRVVNHPGVVSILGSGSVGDLHFLTMDYVEGKSLRRLLDGSMTAGRAIGFARQIAQGLLAAHSCGVIHRDLKPENILVQRLLRENGAYEERLVLVDFGLAGMAEETDPHPNLTKSRMTMGTVNYMAPEQRTDAKRVDERADIYALGVILYELLTGDLPLGRFKLPTERGLKLPLSIDECISKTLDREREKRFVDCAAVDAALRAIEEELERAASKQTVIGRSPVKEAAAGVSQEQKAEVRTFVDSHSEFESESESESELQSVAADSEYPSFSELGEDEEHWDEDSDSALFSNIPENNWSEDATEKAMRTRRIDKKAASIPLGIIAVGALLLGALLTWFLSSGEDEVKSTSDEIGLKSAAQSEWILPKGWKEKEENIEVNALAQSEHEMARRKIAFIGSALRAEGVLLFSDAAAEGYGAFFFLSKDNATQIGVALQSSGEVHLLKIHKEKVTTHALPLKAKKGEKVFFLCSVAQKKCNIQVGDAAEKGIAVDELAYSDEWFLGLGCRDARCNFQELALPKKRTR